MNGIKERVGKARTDIPWTEDELDPELVNQVENYANANRPVILSLFEKYPDVNRFVFKSRPEAAEWMSGLVWIPTFTPPSYAAKRRITERLAYFYDKERWALSPSSINLTITSEYDTAAE